MSRLMTICFIFRLWMQCWDLCVSWSSSISTARLWESMRTYHQRGTMNMIYACHFLQTLLIFELAPNWNAANFKSILHDPFYITRAREWERPGGRTNTIDITNGKEDTKCAWLTNLKLLKRTDNCIGRLK